MTTEAKIQLTSSELGTLWMTYISISARIIMYDFFAIKTIDKKAQNILNSNITEERNIGLFSILKIINSYRTA